MSLVNFLTRELVEEGHTFEAITDATTPHLYARHSSGEGSPVEVAIIRGLLP